jgi:nucleoside-diphosphate-sugar epimerase
VWNTLRPAAMREDPAAGPAVAEQTFPWVHVRDLAALAADLATTEIPDSADPAHGPVPGACTPLNVAGGPATQRDYVGAVTRALGVEPVWEDAPAWTGAFLADRARAWGWTSSVELAEALAEVVAGLDAAAPAP